jgi:hypothetical protein
METSNGLNAHLDAATPTGKDVPSGFPAMRTLKSINTSNFDSTNGTTAVVLDDNSTDTLPAAVVSQGAGYPEILVVIVRSFKIPSGTTVNVSGARALAVVSHFDIYIAGTLDASGLAGGPGRYGLANCQGSYFSNASGGGGGWSSGGASSTTGSGGQSYYSVVPLIGGCGGGASGTSLGSTSGGRGGGAIQLDSRTRIAVAATGLINVGGEGGPAGCASTIQCDFLVAFGGGAGGALLFESPTVLMATSSVVAGRGGNGAQIWLSSFAGESYGSNGQHGSVTGSANPANPPCSGGGCGVGGTGGTETSNPGGWGSGTGSAKGGGGGGVGHCTVKNAAGSFTPAAGTMKLRFDGTSVIPTRP